MSQSLITMDNGLRAEGTSSRGRLRNSCVDVVVVANDILFLCVNI